MLKAVIDKFDIVDSGDKGKLEVWRPLSLRLVTRCGTSMISIPYVSTIDILIAENRGLEPILASPRQKNSSLVINQAKLKEKTYFLLCSIAFGR